jgi:hypothetical protein
VYEVPDADADANQVELSREMGWLATELEAKLEVELERGMYSRREKVQIRVVDAEDWKGVPYWRELPPTACSSSGRRAK